MRGADAAAQSERGRGRSSGAGTGKRPQDGHPDSGAHSSWTCKWRAGPPGPQSRGLVLGPVLLSLLPAWVLSPGQGERLPPWRFRLPPSLGKLSPLRPRGNTECSSPESPMGSLVTWERSHTSSQGLPYSRGTVHAQEAFPLWGSPGPPAEPSSTPGVGRGTAVFIKFILETIVKQRSRRARVQQCLARKGHAHPPPASWGLSSSCTPGEFLPNSRKQPEVAVRRGPPSSPRDLGDVLIEVRVFRPP